MFGEYNNSFILDSLESIIDAAKALQLKVKKILNGECNDNNLLSYIANNLCILLALILTLMFTIFLLIRWLFSLVLKILHIPYAHVYTRGMGIKYLINNSESRNILLSCALCLFAFVYISVLSHRDYAREQNIEYFDYRSDLNYNVREYSYNYESEPRNELQTVLLNSSKINKDNVVVQELKQKYSDGEYNNIFFSSVYDFFVYLFYVGDNENLSRCLEIDLDCGFTSDKKLFTRDILAPACTEAFVNSRFCESKLYLNQIFKNSGGASISSYPDYNNTFYLLRMFLENIEDRYKWTFFWGYEYEHSYLEGFITDRWNSIKTWGEVAADKYVTPNMADISHYINGLYLFYYRDHDQADAVFTQLVNNSTSEIIKQYSAYMIVRNAYYRWDYSNWKNAPNAEAHKELFEEKRSQYAPLVEIKYLANTLEQYSKYQI